MGRVARYKKAKQFQYQIKKEPDLLGPEGTNVPPKPAGSDPTKQMPASLRRMIAAQEKMKEIEAGKGKRKRGEDASTTTATTTTTTTAQGDKGAAAAGKKRKKADKGTKTNGVKDEQDAEGIDEPETKKQRTEEAPPEKIKFEGMRPNESYKQFMRRLRQDTRAALHEKAMEEKKSLSRARKQKLKEKEERRKQRKLAKKEGEDFVHKDSVKFGEVVQQPPSLTAKPRVKKSAAAVVADAMKQKQQQQQGQSPNDGAKKKKEKKKMTKEEKREERERRQKMTEEEKEREKAQEEKEARERRAKQLLLARVMESYKQSKDQKKKQLKEMDPALKRETVHYL